MTEIEQMTREVAEWLHPNSCWHNVDGVPHIYSDGSIRRLCRYCHKIFGVDEIDNPEYTSPAGRVRLLKEMEKHKDGPLFFAKLIYSGNNVEAIDDDGLIPRRYITDETGLLLRAVYEFMRRKI